MCLVEWSLSFPDFPGCVTAGKTLDEAHRMAVEALRLHIEGMLEDGDAIPAAAILDTLANDPAMKGAVAFLENVDFAEKAKRFNITTRNRRMEKIDRRANRILARRS